MELEAKLTESEEKGADLKEALQVSKNELEKSKKII